MKEIKRGYVKWEDENGFHKEPLYKHPDLLADASVEEQIAAEEVRRLNEAAEEFQEETDEDAEQEAWDVLHALKGAPDDVLTVAQLAEDSDGEPLPEAAEIITSEDLHTIDAPQIEARAITASSIPAGSHAAVKIDDDSNDGNKD